MLQIWSTYHNEIMSYYHNIINTWTNKVQPYCTLRTPFDIAFDDLFDYGYNPKRSLQTYMFLQIYLYLSPQGVSRHDVCAFDVNFTTKRGDASRGMQTAHKWKKQKSNVQDMGPQKWKQKTMCRIWTPKKSKQKQSAESGSPAFPFIWFDF